MRTEDRVGDDVAVCAGLRPAFHRVVAAGGRPTMTPRWLIAHEHASVPVYVDESEKAATDMKP